MAAEEPARLRATFQHDFNTRYYTAQEGYDRVHDLAAQYPNIAKEVKAPEQTWGYMRRAATMVGYQQASYVTFAPLVDPQTGLTYQAPNGSTTTLSAANAAKTVVLRTKAWGHEGGNDYSAQLVDPNANNAPLTVSLADKKLTVSLATNATGAITSTAAQVIAAVNGDRTVGTVIEASKYRTSAADGVVVPTRRLAAQRPAEGAADDQARPAGPVDPPDRQRQGQAAGPEGRRLPVLPGARRRDRHLRRLPGDDVAPGEELRDRRRDDVVRRQPRHLHPAVHQRRRRHARDLRLAAAHQHGALVRGHHDVPGEPDGPDLPQQLRRQHQPQLLGRLGLRRLPGRVDHGLRRLELRRPVELSEPETRNEIWIQNTFKNIKFSNNIHSSGGYFMWVPGLHPERETLPYPDYGTLNFFDQTASHVLSGIKAHRGTAILPQKTGPVIDVLYSAAGNSADQAWYVNGIVGYDFEIGDTHYNEN